MGRMASILTTVGRFDFHVGLATNLQPTFCLERRYSFWIQTEVSLHRSIIHIRKCTRARYPYQHSPNQSNNDQMGADYDSIASIHGIFGH